MIQDIEEESKTKFSMDVEFSFSFKGVKPEKQVYLTIAGAYDIVCMGKTI